MANRKSPSQPLLHHETNIFERMSRQFQILTLSRGPLVVSPPAVAAVVLRVAGW